MTPTTPTPPHPPAGQPTPPPRPKAIPGRFRAIVQVVGFTIGIALLVWCVRTVMGPDNRAALDKLQDASVPQVLTLMGLAASSIVLNAVIFSSIIRPLHKLRLSDMIAVNALATFLSYLPFKVSVICRWVIHNRRDGIHNMTIGAWFVVVAILTVVTVAPMWLAFARPEGAGHWWWLVVALTIAAAHTVGCLAARVVRGETGLRRLRRVGLPEKLLHKEWFNRLHDGATMSADVHSVWVSTVARVLDIASFGLRFWIAAGIIGVDLSAEEALLIGLAYFVVGIVSPFGTVGTREVGALGMAVGAGVVAAGLDQDALLTGILLVTVAEAITSLVGAGLALAWLRADRLLIGKLRPDTDPDTEPDTDLKTDPDTEPDNKPGPATPDANDEPPHAGRTPAQPPTQPPA